MTNTGTNSNKGDYKINNKISHSFVHSKNIDIIVILMIFIISLVFSFHLTLYDLDTNKPIFFDTTNEQLDNYIVLEKNNKIVIQNDSFFSLHSSYVDILRDRKVFPLGFFSIIGAILSMMSTRLLGKENKLGTLFWLIITINSGAIDFMLGNKSAVITYPLTFIIASIGFINWKKNIKVRKIDSFYSIVLIMGFVISYTLVFLGFYLFQDYGNYLSFSEIINLKSSDLFFHSIAISFGLSISGNIGTAFKYEDSWITWIIYNIFNLIKNIMQWKIDGIVKYFIYLLNAGFSLVDWKENKSTNKY